MRRSTLFTVPALLGGLTFSVWAEGDQRPLLPADAPPCVMGPKTDAARPLAPRTEAGEPYAFYAVDGEPPAPGKSSDGRLALHLAGPQRLKAGQLLKLTHRIENRGTDGAAIVLPLDGSGAHWRFPTFDLYLRDARGVVWRQDSHQPRCGMTNALREEDVLTLAPGQARAVSDAPWSPLRELTIDVPGTYTAWWVYTLCPGAEEAEQRLLGGHPVAFGQWASPPLTLTVSAAK